MKPTPPQPPAAGEAAHAVTYHPVEPLPGGGYIGSRVELRLHGVTFSHCSLHDSGNVRAAEVGAEVVRALGSHAALVEALEGLYGACPPALVKKWPNIHAKVKTALALAKGGAK